MIVSQSVTLRTWHQLLSFIVMKFLGYTLPAHCVFHAKLTCFLFAAADEARKNYNEVDTKMRKIEDEIR